MRSAAFSLPFWVVLAAAQPEFSPRDIVSAADHSAGRVTPGEIVVLYARNAGPDILAGSQLDSRGRVATELAETRVYFDGVPAPIAYSVKGQVGALVPYEISGRKRIDVVIEYQGLRSSPVNLPVVSAAPALFTLDSTGKGQAAMLNETGCCNSPRNPAVRGDIAILYATGAGQTRPRGITGHVATDARVPALQVPRYPVRVLVGGRSAEIIFAGQAPHAIAGLLQVNFRVPPAAPLGDAVPLILEVGTARSPSGVTMAIRSPVQRILTIGEATVAGKRLTNTLTHARYEVYGSRDGKEAGEQAVLHSPDLILCDPALLDTETIDWLRALRSERPRLKLIAMLPSLDPDRLRSADLLNAEAVLTTHTPAPRLLRTIRELLRPSPVPYATEKLPSFPPAGSRPGS